MPVAVEKYNYNSAGYKYIIIGTVEVFFLLLFIKKAENRIPEFTAANSW